MLIGFVDFWNNYNQTAKEKISRKDYSKVLEEFFTFVVDELLDSKEVVLPERLGSLLIVGRKAKPKIDEDGNIKGLPPDWNKSKKTGIQLVCLNEHTLGLVYKFKWSKKHVFGAFKIAYTLVMSRTNKRKLAQKIKEGKEYFVKI